MQSTVWSELYAARSDWALRSYRDFTLTIDPRLRGDLERQDHVTMVVYGPTQVGKTTLILTTLGIREDCLARVGAVLRGGQQSGKSATVLASRYGKSPDSFWRLGDQNGLDDDAMREALGAIRHSMEDGEDVRSDVVHLRIPHNYFAESGRGLSVSIIDLPGTQAAKEHEVRHVSHLAQKYVPTADVVLLVTRADSLGSLHPAALPLESLKDWAAQPSKFRVVLTYTFSTASIQRWHEKDPAGLSVQSLREHLYGELASHDLSLPQAVAASLFPVEFGDSWRDLSAVPSDYVSVASAISTKLMSELVDGLAQASNPYRRLAAAFDLNALVERKRARLDADYDAHASAARAEITETSQLLEMQQEAASVTRGAKERSEALQKQLGDDGMLKRLEIIIDSAFSETVGLVTKKTVAAVRRRADEHMDVLIDAWRTIRFDGVTDPSINRTGEEDFPWLDAVMDAKPAAPPDVEKAYADLIETLRRHKLADYFTWVPGSSFQEDCALLSVSGRDAQRIAKSASMTWVKSGLEVARESAKHSVEKATRTVKAVEADVDRLRRLKLDLDERLARRDHDYLEACEGMRGSIDQSRVFRQRMTEGHRRRDEELIEEIREEGDAPRRFFLLAIRELHQREFPQALEGSFA